jgi:hypothetical protein
MTVKSRTLGVYTLVAALLVGVQVVALHTLGQPWIAADGVIRLWESDPFSVRMSQELADWYSFSHLIHGFIFYGLLRLAAPRLPVPARLLIAMGVEIGWEIAENSPFVIDAYRKQALAAGYVGDSILNSVSDTAMMSTGFFIASRLRTGYVVALAICFELLTAFMIRDGLALNILNFAAPIPAVHAWQAGARGKSPEN